jgi:phosphoglycolate phosphatase-like HAD superfamily hydrolase
MAASVSLRLAMFDCDGTLVDSQHAIFASVRAHAIVESFAALPPAVRELVP